MHSRLFFDELYKHLVTPTLMKYPIHNQTLPKSPNAERSFCSLQWAAYAHDHHQR